MSFDSLSNELFLQIIDHVSYSHLPILALCSRRIYEFTKAALYSTVALYNETTLTKFLRTVFTEKNAHLPLLVKELTDCCDLEKVDIFSLSDENRSYMDEAIYSVCGNTSYATSWKTALLAREGDAATALLLSLLSNLESISMEVDGRDGVPFMEFVLNKANFGTAFEEPSGQFSRLRKVSLNYRGHDTGLDLCVVWPFLKLKSVTHFTSRMLLDDEEFPGTVSQEVVSNVSHVSLRFCRLDRYAMNRFLHTFPRLKSFDYYQNSPLDVDFGLIAPDIREALSHTQHSLEELVVTSITARGTVAVDEMEPIGSLSDFERLKVITISVYLLIKEEVQYFVAGADGDLVANYASEKVDHFLASLPASLEVLTLIDCSETIFDFFDYAFTVELPPKLKGVHLVFPQRNTQQGQPRRDLEDWLALERRAADKGVVLSRAWMSRWAKLA